MRSEGSFPAAGELDGISPVSPSGQNSPISSAIAWFVRKKGARKRKDVDRWISFTGLDGQEGDCSVDCPRIPIRMADGCRE
jgi:hypothetical protein